MEAVAFETVPVNGSIDIPMQYRQDFSTPIEVILVRGKPVLAKAEAEKELQAELEKGIRSGEEEGWLTEEEAFAGLDL
jgi:hypothetical protein